MLMPADPFTGFIFVEKVTATDVVVLDSVTEPPGVSIWDTSDVWQFWPTQQGKPPYGEPEGIRLYVLVDNGVDADITDGETVEIDVIPRYASLG